MDIKRELLLAAAGFTRTNGGAADPLANIKIEHDGFYATIVATNSHVLLMVKTQCAGAAGTLLVPASAVKTACKGKTSKTLNDIIITNDSITNPATGVTVNYVQPQAEFPVYTRALPRLNELEPVAVTISPTYMALVGDTISAICPMETSVSALGTRAGFGPIAFVPNVMPCGCEKLAIIVMPMRIAPMSADSNTGAVNDLIRQFSGLE